MVCINLKYSLLNHWRVLMISTLNMHTNKQVTLHLFSHFYFLNIQITQAVSQWHIKIKAEASQTHYIMWSGRINKSEVLSPRTFCVCLLSCFQTFTELLRSSSVSPLVSLTDRAQEHLWSQLKHFKVAHERGQWKHDVCIRGQIDCGSPSTHE